MFASAAWGETIILKDGTFVDGEIVRETTKTIRVQSIYGVRTYERRDIDQLIETVDYADADSVDRFEELPGALKAVLNARADYALGNYDRAMSRLEPFVEYDENPAVKITVDWLIIELYERLGRWEDAQKKLEDKEENGNPREKLRAKAHLDIFKRNPDYDLRYIGTKQARNFLVIADADLRDRAREPNSLTDPVIMHAALAEYCEQLLQSEGFSVHALERSFRLRETYEALLERRSGVDVRDALPYADMLKRAEYSISKAQAVLPGYGNVYEIHLVRVELSHIVRVWDYMSQQMQAASPRLSTPAFNAQTGRLTREGRQELVAQCDEFIDRSTRVLNAIEYIVTKIERYPGKLGFAAKFHDIAAEYHENLIKWAKKLRRKTRV